MSNDLQMGRDTSARTRQMQGETSASYDAFHQAATLVRPPAQPVNTPPTRFSALLILPEMREPIHDIIKSPHDTHAGKFIAVGYGDPVPIKYKEDPIAYAAVNDRRNGLQIVLFSIQGDTHRKDGIPFHMIWSHRSGADTHLVTDDSYTLPRNELSLRIKHNDDKNCPWVEFTQKALPPQQLARTLPIAALEAEQLARQSFPLAAEKTPRIHGDIEILPMNISMTSRLSKKSTIGVGPQFYIVTHEAPIDPSQPYHRVLEQPDFFPS